MINLREENFSQIDIIFLMFIKVSGMISFDEVTINRPKIKNSVSCVIILVKIRRNHQKLLPISAQKKIKFSTF